ncbi:uncharacterized protein LOC120539510 [Polypterus senegalus]|uniref:uncharacterized protein LOC120539510 n=1 Tax=Polypterus senegalus TaxID=55291 RepID=UPI00196582D3|nr:uncharacterized protein LOC120539510 [Polypterus senegalus]
MAITLNNRGSKESLFLYKHKSVEELREEKLNEHMWRLYLRRRPLLPKVKLTISKLQHVTTRTGVKGIIEEGFKGASYPNFSYGPFSYWSGVVDPEEVKTKIRNWIENNTELDPSDMNANSLAFSEKSLFGNYKFSLDFKDMLSVYKKKFCGGEDAVFRVFGTSCFKQQIAYTVIVHSPYEDQFCDFPLLPNDADNSICGLEDDTIFWRPESVSNVNEYKEDESIDWGKYFVWDNLVFAFHVDVKHYLKFEKAFLLKHLTPCHLYEVNICKEKETRRAARNFINRLKYRNR